MRQRTVGFISTVLAIVIIFMFVPAKSDAQEPLILGIHPFLSSTELYRRFSPLADYLSRELDRPVQIHIASSYESHINSTGKGKVDIAIMGPASYVKLTRRFGRVPLLAAFETNGNRTFRGVIVVRKDSQIKTLSQLRGKKFAFGDVNSTMGHLMPRYMLLNAGVDVKQLGKADFLTNHDNIALGVLSGNFDAGALKLDIYNDYAQQGLRALDVSHPMPDHIFVARAGLPDDTVRRVSEILLSLKDTEDGRLVLSSIQKNLTALVQVRDSDYDPLRRLLDFLAKSGVKP